VVMLTPEQKKAQFQRRAKIALMIGAGILFAPVAVAAIGGLVGLGVADKLGELQDTGSPNWADVTANDPGIPTIPWLTLPAVTSSAPTRKK
jgi:hypothetical protein